MFTSLWCLYCDKLKLRDDLQDSKKAEHTAEQIKICLFDSQEKLGTLTSLILCRLFK